MATGVVERLKGEFDANVEWISFELHPETPKEGVLLVEKFPDYDIEALFEELRIMGSKYGCEFGEVKLLANSRLALEASELARAHGKYHAFHAAAFRAYFSDARNIGELAVVLDIAEKSGIDAVELQKALTEGRYRDCLEKGREEGARYSVSALPTFVFDGREKIVGMRPIETFRQVLAKLSRESS